MRVFCKVFNVENKYQVLVVKEHNIDSDTFIIRQETQATDSIRFKQEMGFRSEKKWEATFEEYSILEARAFAEKARKIYS